MHAIVIVTAKYAIVIPALAAIWLFFRLGKQQRVEVVVLFVSSAIFTVALMKLAATLHQDPRPFVRDAVHPYFAHAADNGFPSDHTTASALVAFVALRYRRKLGILLAVLSLLIGTTRVIAGVHHGQDIIAGFIIAACGVGLGVLLLRVIPLLKVTNHP